jgi:oligopeptidase B
MPPLDLNAAAPPVAARKPAVRRIHGESLPDDYFWLREKTNPEVAAYLNAENAYAAAVMKPTEALQERLYQEMIGRIKETDLSVPYRYRDYEYYTRTEQGLQYPIYLRRPVASAGKEEIVLDVNELAKDKPFCSISAFAVSDDGKLLAYSVDFSGFREYELRVRDLTAGRDLPDRFGTVAGVEWASDNRTLLYVREDDAKRPYQFFRQTLGGKPELIYEEKDRLFNCWLTRTRDRKYFILNSSSFDSSEIRILPCDKPDSDPKRILRRQKEHRYYVDHRDGLLYIRTNKEAKNFRVVTAPVAKPGEKNWKELVPYRKGVQIEGLDLFDRYMALKIRENAVPRIIVYELGTGEHHEIQFPESFYNVYPGANMETDTDTLRLQYSSYTTPQTVYDYDIRARRLTVLKQQEVPSGFNSQDYVTELTYAAAKDGVRIPISMVYHRSTKKSKETPLLLYGYGSYGAPMSASFDTNRFSLLDRGMIWATAHIRGGGELGEEWHDAGKMQHKMNSFTDFIACAEHLIEQSCTSREKLAIMGGSAGGLLMGAVLNLRPDLFRTAMIYVPFVDVINTMLDESLPLTVQEYLEWGNPRKKEQFAWMRAYSPYDNLKAGEYPAILVRTAFNDSQVMYWEPAKYVARLRTLKTDRNPLLLVVNMHAGHGGSSGRYDKLREVAHDYAFLMATLGIEERP